MIHLCHYKKIHKVTPKFVSKLHTTIIQKMIQNNPYICAQITHVCHYEKIIQNDPLSLHQNYPPLSL